jgi:hypothetical protein
MTKMTGNPGVEKSHESHSNFGGEDFDKVPDKVWMDVRGVFMGV